MSESLPSVGEVVRKLHGESRTEATEWRDSVRTLTEMQQALPYFVPAAFHELITRPGLELKRPETRDAIQEAIDSRRDNFDAWLLPTASCVVGGVRVDRDHNNKAIRGAVTPIRVEYYKSNAPEPTNTADAVLRVRWIWPGGWDKGSVAIRETLQRRLGSIVRWVASFASREWSGGVWVVYPVALHPHTGLVDTVPPALGNAFDESSISSLELAIAMGVYGCMRGQQAQLRQTEPAFWATGAFALNTEPPPTRHNGPPVVGVRELPLKSRAVADHLDAGLSNTAVVPFLLPAERADDESVDDRLAGSVCSVETLADALAACGEPLPERAPHWAAFRTWAHSASKAVADTALQIGGRNLDVYVERQSHNSVLQAFVHQSHKQPVLVVEGASGTGKTWWSATMAAAMCSYYDVAVLYSTVLTTAADADVLTSCTPLPEVDATATAVAGYFASVLRTRPAGRVVWFVDALDRYRHNEANFDRLLAVLECDELAPFLDRLRVVVTAQHHPVDKLLERRRDDKAFARAWLNVVWDPSPSAAAHDRTIGETRPTTRFGRFSEGTGLRLPGLAAPDQAETQQSAPEEYLLGRAYDAYRQHWRRMPRLFDVSTDLRDAIDHPAILRVFAESYGGEHAIDETLLDVLGIDRTHHDIGTVMGRAAVARVGNLIAPAERHTQLPLVFALLAFVARDIVEDPTAQPRSWRQYPVLIEEQASGVPSLAPLADDNLLELSKRAAINSGLLRVTRDAVRKVDVADFELELWISYFAAHAWRNTLAQDGDVAEQLAALIADKAVSVEHLLGRNAISHLAAELLRLDPAKWAGVVHGLLHVENTPVGLVFEPWVHTSPELQQAGAAALLHMLARNAADSSAAPAFEPWLHTSPELRQAGAAAAVHRLARNAADSSAAHLEAMHAIFLRIPAYGRQAAFSASVPRFRDLIPERVHWAPVLDAVLASTPTPGRNWLRRLARCPSLSIGKKEQILLEIPHLTESQIVQLGVFFVYEDVEFDLLAVEDPARLDEWVRLRRQHFCEWRDLVAKLAHERGIPVPW